jgi:hypothetical protein
LAAEQVEHLASILRPGEAREPAQPTRARAVDLLEREGAACEQALTFTQAALDARLARYLRRAFPRPGRSAGDSDGFSLADVQAFSCDELYMSALEERVLPPALAAVTDAAVRRYSLRTGRSCNRTARFPLRKPG